MAFLYAAVSFLSLVLAVTACTTQVLYDGAPVWPFYSSDPSTNTADTSLTWSGKATLSWSASQTYLLQFHHAGDLVSSSFSKLHFMVNGGQGGQQQRILFTHNGAQVGQPMFLVNYNQCLQPNRGWVSVDIPIADFGMNQGTLFDGLMFQSMTGSSQAQNTLWLADIQIVCVAGTSSTAAATMSVTTVSATTGATAATTISATPRSASVSSTSAAAAATSGSVSATSHGAAVTSGAVSATTGSAATTGHPAPHPTLPPASAYHKGPAGPYRTQGGLILDHAGRPHIFKGWARPSFEWSVQGEGFSLHDFQLQAATGANVVRLSLNQNFWLTGAAGWSVWYSGYVDIAVKQAKQAGLSVILDLHWSDQGQLSQWAGQQVMADANSLQFWREVATKYKHDPEVIFELYNEPHDVSCDVWMHGGWAGGFQAVGMQQMYNVIRGAGAENLVIVNGLNWGFDLTCLHSTPMAGHNIIFGTHVYFNYGGKQTPSDWDNSFGWLTAQHPVMATEFGDYDCSVGGYQTFLGYLHHKRIGFTAWAWYPKDCAFPSLIQNWGGALTFAGGVVRDHLHQVP